MTFIWGTNYPLVKSAFREIDPQAFNALRLVLASCVMVATSRIAGRMARPDPVLFTSLDGAPLTFPISLRARAGAARRFPPVPACAGGGEVASIFHTPAEVTPRDWIRLAWLGIVGHCFYQYLFVGGLARTSVANGVLLMSSTPILITLLSAISEKERIGALHWAGMLLSLFGISIVVGRGPQVSGASLAGDAMLVGSVVCWAVYTIGARPLMARHSPVGVTALSMLIGTLVYLPLAAPNLGRVPWGDVSAITWIKLVYSSLFAICVAYTIWYAAVRAIGSARTSVYSNLLPIVAMLTAYFWLHEPMGVSKVVGAAAVLAGVALTRMGQARLQIPQ